MVILTRIAFTNSFRTKFVYPDKNVLHWFPGHMGKGIKQIQQKLKNVDCIIEVHDARIPISGRNRNFKSIFGDLKPHVLVLNKSDLADLSNKKAIRSYLTEEGVTSVLFTNCKDLESPDLKKLVPTIQELVSKSDRYNRTEKKENVVMVTGVPNVGKSSIINALRHKNLKKSRAAPVGGIAGVTRSVSSKIKVSELPLIYVMDTPGILEPTVTDMESGFKLALCSSMQDHLVGPINIADFLLFWLNKTSNFSYVQYLKLKEPTDNIMELLILVAVNMGKTQKKRHMEGGYTVSPDIEYAANYLITAFREGALGKIMLDDNFR